MFSIRDASDPQFPQQETEPSSDRRLSSSPSRDETLLDHTKAPARSAPIMGREVGGTLGGRQSRELPRSGRPHPPLTIKKPPKPHPPLKNLTKLPPEAAKTLPAAAMRRRRRQPSPSRR